MSRSAEDAILDDDIQSKDDYELDLDDANALLDLDDDETTSTAGKHAGENEANVEYVDEEGNPVAVCDGDDLEVVDEYSYSESRANDDGDVLDVDVDPDFDSLLQEGEDAESGTSSQSRSQRHHTPQQPQRTAQNSTPTLCGKPEEPISSTFGVEPAPSPCWSQSESMEKESSSRPVEDEEEDEEEGGRQGRFHAERRAGNVIATALAKRRQGIPDSLDQVISEADVARIDAYLGDDRRHPGRRGRGRGGGNFRGQNAKRGGGSGGPARGGGLARGGYRGSPAQHIEPWVAPPFPLHTGPGLVQFGVQSPPQQQRPFHHAGAVASGGGEGPRGKIFVNPQFRNGPNGLAGHRGQVEGRPLGVQPFQQSPRGPPPFGSQQPEPFLRPPFTPQGPLLMRPEPFMSAAMLHPVQQPPPHVPRPSPPHSTFTPALEHFIAPGQPSGLQPFEMSAQASRPSEFGGPQPSGGNEAFRQPQPLEPWRSPPAGRLPPDMMQPHQQQQQQQQQQQHRPPMRQQQQQQQQLHHSQHQQHQQQLQHHQQQNLHGQFGVPFPTGVAVQHQQVLQQQHQQHQLQQHHHHQQQQQQFHQQAHQQQQQRQQRPGSPMRGVHPFPPSLAFQGGPGTREPGSPLGHTSGPAHLDQQAHQQAQQQSHQQLHQQHQQHHQQQQQRQFHPPPPQAATGNAFGPPGSAQGGGPLQAYGVPGQASTGFGVPPRFQTPPREHYGKRPPPQGVAQPPAKTVRVEANRMPRKANLGPPARTVNNANIKEVPIVDYLPPPEPEKEALPAAIEEDAATQELRRKIEEQKKLRAQVMRIKEERRKLAVMQRQRDLLEQRLQGGNNAEPQPGPAPVPDAAASVPAVPLQPSPTSVKQRLGVRAPVAAPAQLPEGSPVLKKVVIVRRAGQQQPAGGAGVSTAIQAPAAGAQANAEVHAGAPRGIVSLQGRGGANVTSRIGPVRGAGLATTSSPAAPRKVIRIVSSNGRLQAVNTGAAGIVHPAAANVPQAVRPQAPGGHMMRPPSGLATNPAAIGRVLVSNLSASTTENSLRQLGRKCGVVTEIILDRNQRQAVIKFREHQHAVLFRQRHQRHMLDLSMIQVSLLPP